MYGNLHYKIGQYFLGMQYESREGQGGNAGTGKVKLRRENSFSIIIWENVQFYTLTPPTCNVAMHPLPPLGVAPMRTFLSFIARLIWEFSHINYLAGQTVQHNTDIKVMAVLYVLPIMCIFM